MRHSETFTPCGFSDIYWKARACPLFCSVEILIRSSFLLYLFLLLLKEKKKQQSGWDKYFWDIHLLCQLRLTWLTDSKGFTENWHLDTHKLQKLSVFMCEPGWFILEIRKRSENYMYSLAFPHLHTISANNGSVNNFQWYPTIHYQPKSEENETPIVFYLCMCSCFSPTILLCE